MSKHDDQLLGSRSHGPDAETPLPALGLDAFDPIDEDDELVEDLRTVRMRVPHRRAVPSDIPEPGLHFAEEPARERDDESASASAAAVEQGLDTEPIAGRTGFVHEVTPPVRAPSGPPSLAERAVRPKSALDAAREAADREAAASATPARPTTPSRGARASRASCAGRR